MLLRQALARGYSASKLKLEIAHSERRGYINNFVVKGEGVKRSVRIFLRYDARARRRLHLARVSRPGGACMLARMKFRSAAVMG